MSDEKTFDLIVENNQYQASLELTNLQWNGDSPPMAVVMPSGIILVKSGRYLSEGNRYCYHVATVADLVDGKLWPRES